MVLGKQFPMSATLHANERRASQEELGGGWRGATASNLLKNRFPSLPWMVFAPWPKLPILQTDGYR